jgi:hypothetical protein
MAKTLSRFCKGPIRDDPLQQNSDPQGRFSMNRFLLLIACALVGILVSSCAPIPHRVAPKPVYGSHSGAPHYLPLRHPPRRAADVVHHRAHHATDHHRHAQRTGTIATHHRAHHATDHHRHAQRRGTIATHHRLLNPWNHLPAASETPAPANATTPPHTNHLPEAPEAPATPKGFEIRPPAYWRWQ